MLEIQHALAVEVGDSTLDEDNIPEEGLLLSVCNGLVTYEKEGGFLALVHYTFQQYLEQKAENLFPEAQVEIVRTCLTYLSFDEFAQGPCRDDKDFTVRLKRRPLLNYAVPEWGRHACQGAELACRELILSFFSQSTKMSASVQLLWVRESMGVKYTRRFPSRVSALWLASHYGLQYTMSHLLASPRRNVNQKTSWGDTALHRAAGTGNVEILELLLRNGASVAAKDCHGNTPLHLATFFWFKYDRLTSKGPKTLSWKEQKARRSEISQKVTQSLLNHGADVNAISLRGETALHVSVMQGQKPLTELLLARGADVTLKNEYGNAPLTLASASGDGDIVPLLLEHDLQRQIECGILKDAIRKAVSKNHVSVLEKLLPKSSEQSPTDPEGRNLLHISATCGGLKCFQYLESRGFDLEALDKQKRTCLHSAAANRRIVGSHEVLEYLLEQGLDPSQSDVDGWTPLLWAAKAGHTTEIQILLDASTDSIYQGDREWVPFAVATFHENTRAAAMLRPSNRPLPVMFQTHQSSISLRHPGVICDGCDLVSRRNVDSLSIE